MSRNARLEIRLQSDDEILLEIVKEQLEEIWPFAFSGEIAQNDRNPKLGWFRVYLNLSLPVSEQEED